MNTAQPIHDINYNNVIVSPRRQGAGLVDVKAAIDALEKNPSTVVAENGYPAVELKDFTGTDKTFKRLKVLSVPVKSFNSTAG